MIAPVMVFFASPAFCAAGMSGEGPSISFARWISESRLWLPVVLFVLALAGLAAWNRILAREIRTRKKAERALKESEKALRSADARLRPFIEANLVGIVIVDASGRVIEANDYYLNAVGYTREEFERGKVDWRTLTPPEWLPADERAIEELRARGSSTPHEKEYVRRDGTRVSVFISDALLPGPEERIIAFVLDITKRKRAEEALQEANAVLQALIQSSPLAIIAIDPDGNVTLWNPAAERMFGWTEREALGRFLPLVPDDKRDEHRAMRRSVMRGEGFTNVEARRRRKDGTPIDISISTAPMRDAQGRIFAIMSVSADVTERKKAEEELRRIERNLAEAERIGNTGSWDYDVATDTAAWSENMFRMLGVDPAMPRELVFTYLVENLVHPDDRARVLSVFQDALAGLRPYDLEFRIIKKNGDVTEVHSIAETVRDGEGKAVRMIGKAEDITERKRAELALKEKEAQLRFVLEGTNDGFWDVDMKSNRVFMSPRGCEILGFSPEEMTENFEIWSKLVHPDDMEATRKALAAHVEGAAPIFSVEQRLAMKSGEWKWVLARGKIVARDEDGNPSRITGTHTDISERRRAEEIVQASLREKETLLREIHHRVKNNMQVISSLLNLQSAHIADGEARRMLREGQLRIRSMALIHEKLYRARDLSKIEFASYLKSLAAYLFEFFKVDPARVRLVTEFEDVRLDINTAVPCGLLVNELVSNALKHAFPGDRKGSVRVDLRREGDGALTLRVTDDGVGFPESVDFRRAESFGLQIVGLLAEQLDASIALDTKKGTAFTVAFRELGYKPRT